MKKLQEMNKRYLMLGIGVALSIILGIYVWTMFKVFVRYDKSLPFIWDNKINQTIHEYLQTQPSRHVLLITGPYQTGKSEMINILASDLREKDIFPITIDVSAANNRKELFGLTKISLLESIQAYKSNQGVNFSLYREFEGMVDLARNDTTGVIQFLEKLENLNLTHPPVFMVKSAQKFAEFAMPIYNTASAIFSRRNQYFNHVPVILVMTDSSFLMNPIPDSFRIIETEGIEDIVQNFVNDIPAFSKKEMKKILASIGSHGGSIDRIFEDLRIDIPIDTALLRELSNINETVQQTMNITGIPVIKRICENRERPIQVNTPELESVIPLLHKGLLYLSNDAYLRCANKGVFRAVCN